MSAEISSPRVLIIEDESTIARFIAAALQDEGFTTFIEGTMKGGLTAAFPRQPDLLIVDLGLPDGDGLDLIGAVRAKMALPMIVLSARTDEKQKIQALDLGADDYLIKPFSFDELSARLRVMTRKKYGGKTGIISVGDLTVDTASRRVERAGREISLSAKEYELLCYLVMNKGVVLSREKIEDHIWNYDYEGGTNVVDVYIRYLRKKIDEGEDTKLIHTVRGAGYVIR